MPVGMPVTTWLARDTAHAHSPRAPYAYGHTRLSVQTHSSTTNHHKQRRRRQRPRRTEEAANGWRVWLPTAGGRPWLEGELGAVEIGGGGDKRGGRRWLRSSPHVRRSLVLEGNTKTLNIKLLTPIKTRKAETILSARCVKQEKRIDRAS